MTEMPPYLAVKDEEKNGGDGDNDSCSDVDDWDLPLSYDKPRHREPIKGDERVEHSWRVKEKVRRLCLVSKVHKLFTHRSSYVRKTNAHVRRIF